MQGCGLARAWITCGGMSTSRNEVTPYSMFIFSPCTSSSVCEAISSAPMSTVMLTRR